VAELDQAAELATEAIDVAAVVVRNHINWMWGGGMVGLGIGLGAGYLIANRLLETKYEKISEQEIDQMREHFRERMVARERKPDLSDLNKRIVDAGYAGPGDPNVSKPPDEIRNVFESKKDSMDGWDQEAETASREHREIYVIHQDEYGDTNHEKATLSYFEGDDVLCDGHDRVIDNQTGLVGDECLDRFGHGSGDRNIVYIRNERLNIDLEVIRSEKTYAEEVHGFKHEDSRRRSKR